MHESWDFLVVTASNGTQADSYERQLDLRRSLGLLEGFRNVLVVADPGGHRVGSGGSTIYSILKVLDCCLPDEVKKGGHFSAWFEKQHPLRVLILHAGGESRRLPTYGPCGKLFVPLPGDSDLPFNMTLFDRQLPTYKALPFTLSDPLQVVITSGDVLLDFDPRAVQFSSHGVTGLGCYATPEQARNHGVFCARDKSRVDLYLQKPSPQKQMERGAISRHGQTIMDIGVMNLGSQAVWGLLEIVETEVDSTGNLVWAGPSVREITRSGLDFYREICCAMGSSATPAHHVEESLNSGSRLSEGFLTTLFERVSKIPLSVQVLPRCGFLHFGTLGQLISSGSELLSRDYGVSQYGKCLSINNGFQGDGELVGSRAWVEGTRLGARLLLGGENVVSGLNVSQPLEIPSRKCLDILPGRSRQGAGVFFVRCYGIDDSFQNVESGSLTYCGFPFDRWLSAVGAASAAVWSDEAARESLWEARLFPALDSAELFREFLWMFDPFKATDEQKRNWHQADRYSCQDIAELADRELFHSRRLELRREEVLSSGQMIFRPDCGFSAKELSFLLSNLGVEDVAEWIGVILKKAFEEFGDETVSFGLERMELSRVLHTLSSAVSKVSREKGDKWVGWVGLVEQHLEEEVKDWLETLGILSGNRQEAAEWASQLRLAAFENLSRTIVLGSRRLGDSPLSAMRSDEIVWGRAPARLDLGGGWSDTPPYSLEHGGCVINAAVNLNGQPPIQVYARIIEEPVIRVTSIDHGKSGRFENFDHLLRYRDATDQFALAKAALVLSGFSPETALWPAEIATLEEMLVRFGGGIELTTLAAIPSGSGLGTSSIMGAVLIGVINRLLGKSLSARELFNRVLQLEQELTTGGGWQDQIGGAVSGVKLISTDPGLVPDPRVHFVTSDLVSPPLNGGRTLLYYTGFRRLAKNILRGVVGNYLDRDRSLMNTLRSVHALPPQVAEALAEKDMDRFGRLIDYAWSLNQELDPDSTTLAIDQILERTAPHLLGAKLLGAGGGGFLLMVARSESDARSVRSALTDHPPNERARFFEYEISHEGLSITVC